MNKKRRNIEQAQEDMILELMAERTALYDEDAKLAKKERKANENEADKAELEKIDRSRKNVKLRIQELNDILDHAKVIESQDLADEKTFSDMWVNRLNLAAYTLIGGAGLYLGYKSDTSGGLTNNTPLGFFNGLFRGRTRNNV